jgi:MinD superfamily P-loop ATPase
MTNLKKVISIYKQSAGCRLCGYNANPRALHFAHRDSSTKYRNRSGKTVEPADMFTSGDSKVGARYGEETIWAEIAKCDVLCANCHAEQTHSQ